VNSSPKLLLALAINATCGVAAFLHSAVLSREELTRLGNALANAQGEDPRAAVLHVAFYRTAVCFTGSRHSKATAIFVNETLARDTFIDHPVAIVVKTVADLRRRLVMREAYETSNFAMQRTFATYPRHARTAHSAAFRISVIDCTVAVIVKTVADFRMRSPRNSVTHRARAVGRADHSAHSTAFSDADRTQGAFAREIFVDSAVAIVVKIVARLRYRQVICAAPHTSALAQHCAAAAHSYATWSAILRVFRAIRTGGIAVVVNAVANIQIAACIVAASQRAVVATIRTFGTQIGIRTVTNASEKRVFGAVGTGWIAIVVETVTDFQIVAGGIGTG
jgi:hypothetical protein